MPGYQISIRQEEILINFMERHPWLVSKSGELNGNFTVAKRNDLRGELAAPLNFTRSANQDGVPMEGVVVVEVCVQR